MKRVIRASGEDELRVRIEVKKMALIYGTAPGTRAKFTRFT
ncbi:hypothetical protein [Ligilactobacillus salitolerans]|nr:hypothetical protein [Ligilactobacillus salitolerans]